MANIEEEKGVKEPEGTGDEPESKETTPQSGEDVKTPEQEADELLKKDNLGKDKRVVDADRFNELNDDAKAYKTWAPVIDKIKDKPDIVEELLETKKKGDLESRVARMEEEQKDAKRTEMKGALTEALSKWPTFGKEWEDIRDQVESLMKKGLSARDAMRRSYIALHPEEARAEAERMAREGANILGTRTSSNFYSPKIKVQPSNDVELSPGERQVARALGKSDAEYGQLLKKHEAHMRAKGFYDPALEVEL